MLHAPCPVHAPLGRGEAPLPPHMLGALVAPQAAVTWGAQLGGPCPLHGTEQQATVLAQSACCLGSWHGIAAGILKPISRT